MNETAIKNDSVRTLMSERLNELERKIHQHANNVNSEFIQIGGCLCEVREILESNQAFGEWREIKFPGLHRKTANRWMNAYLNGGFELVQSDIGESAICLLTAPSVPESAREEAVARKDAGEDITAKQAKEIADLHKELEQAKQQAVLAKPSMDNLIPELARLHKSGSLPEATALEFSKLDPDIQRYAVLPKFEQVNRQQSEITRLKDEKIAAMETAEKERASRESLQSAYDEAVEKGAAAVIAAKDREIKQREKDLDRLRADILEKVEREQAASIEKRVRAEWQAKVEAESKEREKVERKLRDESDRSKRLVDENRNERMKLEAAEAKLKAAHPIEKDGIHARAIGFLAQDLRATIKKVEGDCEQHQRRLTDAALAEIQEMLAGYFGAQNFIEMEI